MNVSVKLSSEETELIKTYADMHGVTVSEFMKQSVLSVSKTKSTLGYIMRKLRSIKDIL